MRIVIVSYYFPPGTAVGGFRLHGLATHLSAMHEVIVLTAQDGSADDQHAFKTVSLKNPDTLANQMRLLIGQRSPAPGAGDAVGVMGRNPSRLARLRRTTLRFFRTWLYIPDEQRGWASRAAAELTRLNLGCDDVVITSSPPLSISLSVVWARWRGPRPLWIADFRDLPIDGPYYSMKGHSQLRQRLDRRYAMRALRLSDAVTVVSQRNRTMLCESTGIDAHVIYNGYPALRSGTSLPEQPSTRLRFIYAGSLYSGQRNPGVLFAALSDAIAQGVLSHTEVCVEFYGPDSDIVDRLAQLHGLEGVVISHSTTPRSAVLHEIESAHALLLIQSNEESLGGSIPAKLFEYLPAHKPILAFGAQAGSEVEQILEKTHSGVCVQNRDHALRVLTNLASEWRATGGIASQSNDTLIAPYSHHEMTRRFEELIVHLRPAADSS